MTKTMLVAVAALLAVTAVRGWVLPMEGASTMSKLLASTDFKSSISPNSVTYGGNGSGAGKTWVTAGTNANPRQVLAFGDGSFTPLPSSVAEFPVAFGSIAIYVNLPGIPGTVCLSVANQCKIFNANIRSTVSKWGTILSGLPAATANLPVRIVVRSDSSGSTAAIKAYLDRVCPKFGAFRFAVNTATSTPTIAPGYVGADGTSGVVAAISAVRGSVGYAGCGQTRAATLVELPLANQVGTCVVCKNCPASSAAGAPYGANIKCGNYAQFSVRIPANPCAWTGVPVAATKTNDFPIPFAEFAYFNKLNTSPDFCQWAKVVVKKMVSSSLQSKLTPYGFNGISISMRAAACKCIKTLCGGKPTTASGVLTAAGVCL